MNEENVNTITQIRKHIPIFMVSNKTGMHIDILKKYINNKC
jgi:hypothetical protein